MKFKWQQAPVKTQWGDEMVVASVAIDKDHTVCLYCERDQTPKVEAMFALAEQPAPMIRGDIRDGLVDDEPAQQEPVAWAISYDGKTPYAIWPDGDGALLDLEVKRQGGTTCKLPLYTHAQRTWVGLTDDELADLWYKQSLDWMEFARAVEAKLREKNQ